MRSIKTKLMLAMGLLLAIICIGLGTISYYTSSKALIGNVNEVLPQIAKESAKTVNSRVESQLNALEAIASETQISDMNNSWENKRVILDAEVKRSGHIEMNIVDKDGNAINTNGKTANIKNRDYFKKALAGEKNVSDPVLSKTQNAMVIVYAAPIKNGNQIVGVITAVRNGKTLNDITKDITFGKSGQAFMINKQGTAVANVNEQIVLKGDNINEDVKKDSKLKPFADIEKKMMNGESGVGEYTYGGVRKYLGYAPVNGTNWSIAVTSPKAEVLSGTNTLRLWTITASIIFIILGLVFVFILGSKIIKNIVAAIKYLETISSGDLSSVISPKYLELKDETGTLARAVKIMQESIISMIKSIRTNSSEINSHADNLSSISEEIAASSSDVATSMQDVAKGASSQAENLVNITDILNKFGSELVEIIDSIKEVDSNAKGINTMSAKSNTEMEQLAQSMNKLSDSFNDFISKTTTLGQNIKQIDEITSLINSIAEQTNLLALNAAIEAARAGEAGKGFSVVAEEIRELAEQTTESSKNISTLINSVSDDSSIMVKSSGEIKDQLNSQISIVNTTIDSFKLIVNEITQMSSKINMVNGLTANIDSEKSDILGKIEEISSVAEEVSASSEEIAASSEEMNASTEEVAATAHTLADMTNDMKKEITKFKL
ncbi:MULTISPECIES: methyl-accepting chemotaxis protein [Clostridium]|uniref:Methyl-accepting chemotaxis protein McpB n=3 Tax=Clostridium TaxID=1485 RepID=D8GLW1_CLOLD|nr:MULTISPECIES: methyl-accepting chemotaxis protein [Clostridium]ADK15535.1 predicted methyl-accepting chemotaxis protein [Clostridium ljungdahlii DSM 13528]AGY74771.1 methyl-accepting chemotaxis protein [Clostridium autoethanogenum DSM 10061]ALU34950.1 Methyl-accepting chemotaxis sensory transducer with periplasmic Cache sensor and cytosolic HAMP domain [Clostridium autoethanogenum DSM 10061]OAA85460.1 Methyl-accepting chemotaxis protein McpB [Clostridium ljungdahlii DSM 13528]OVY51660.1 Met